MSIDDFYKQFDFCKIGLVKNLNTTSVGTSFKLIVTGEGSFHVDLDFEDLVFLSEESLFKIINSNRKIKVFGHNSLSNLLEKKIYASYIEAIDS